MESLTERERKILEMRLGMDDGYSFTLEEVGLYFGVTRERIRQIEKKAIIKLKYSEDEEIEIEKLRNRLAELEKKAGK